MSEGEGLWQRDRSEYAEVWSDQNRAGQEGRKARKDKGGEKKTGTDGSVVKILRTEYIIAAV